MKRIKNWMQRLSIRKKLIVYVYLIISPILLLISTLLAIRNYHAAIKQEKEICIQNVDNMADSLNTLQTTMEEMGTYICINTDINQIFTSTSPELLNVDSQLWVHEAPMQIIQDMLALNGYIKTIAIYPENGVIPYLRCMDASSYITDFDMVKQTDIYKKAVNSRGKFIWRRVAKKSPDTYSNNREEKIVMYREIYDLSRQNQLGYLVIGASASKFDQVCINSLQTTGEEILVLNAEGEELIRCGDASMEVVEAFLTQETLPSEKQEQGLSFQGYNVYTCKNKETGIQIYKLVPRTTIRGMIADIITTPLALLMGFLIGLYPILIIVSKLITGPLNKLSAALLEFKNGDFNQKVEVTTQDEVGEASACFNQMVEDMKHLIDENYIMALKEKESELDALQAQINPHFLYNALDTLYWQTLDTGNEKIAEDILALSDLFRLVLNRGEGIVAVKSEQELLERYLHIQKMRFGNRLDYRILIDEAILEEPIPKLILQPFVENAVVHGFEKGSENFFLTILGEKVNQYMIFYIRDTGVGMSKEQIDKIWQEEDNRKSAGQRIGKYAIKNVKERLELKYQKDYKLRIESEMGRGTTVMIQIPCEKGK